MISCSFNALREWVRATCHSPATSGISWPLNLESYMQLTVIFLFSFPLCRCCPRLFVSVWVCYWLKNGVVIGGNVLAFCLLPPSFFFLIARHQLCVSVVRWPAWGIFLFQHGRLLFQGQRGQGNTSSFILLPRFTCLSLLRVSYVYS